MEESESLVRLEHLLEYLLLLLVILMMLITSHYLWQEQITNMVYLFIVKLLQIMLHLLTLIKQNWLEFLVQKNLETSLQIFCTKIMELMIKLIGHQMEQSMSIWELETQPHHRFTSPILQLPVKEEDGVWVRSFKLKQTASHLTMI